MYTIKILQENGEVKKELPCEGYVIAGFKEIKEICGCERCGSVEVVADNVSTVEIAAAMATEGTPLNDAHEFLCKYVRKKPLLKRIFGKKES